MSMRIASEPDVAQSPTAIVPVGKPLQAFARATDRAQSPLTYTISSGGENFPEVRGYRIIGKLGRGGMGVVYKAVHLALNRVVALKILSGPANQIDEEIRTRFRKEAEALASLRHPNIVPVYEVGEADGLPFFTMEFVEGGDLAHEIQKRAPSPMEAARIVAQLARGMESAHSAGILHRDLKPSNVLLSEVSSSKVTDNYKTTLRSIENESCESIPKIADFGLAKRFGESHHDRTVTQAGDILGTPSYMAPEQAEGHGAAQIGPHTDIYSLGAILYELLTRQPPFDAGDAVKTVIQVLNEEPVSPSKLVHGIPRDLQTICLKCLQKDPKKRYSSARELAEDLERFVSGCPIVARPASTAERAWKWAKRRPAIAGLIATTAIAVLGGFIGMTALWIRANDRAASEAEAHELAEARRQQLEDQALASEFQLARSYAERGIADCRTDDVPRGLILLARSLEVIEGLRGKNADREQLHNLDDLEAAVRINLNAWQARIPLRVRARFLTVIPGDNRWVIDSDLSPDGKNVVTGSKDGFLRLFDAITNKEIGEPIKIDGAVGGTTFSNDSKRFMTVIFDRQKGLNVAQVWDAATRERLGPTIPIANYIAAPRMLEFCNAGFVSPDILLAQTTPTTLRFYKSGTNEEVRPAIESPVPITVCVPIPGGDTVFTGHRDGSVRRWSIQSGTELAHSETHPSLVFVVAASPDGKKVLAGHWNGAVQVFDAKTLTETCPAVLTKAVTETNEKRRGFLRTADFSPDSRVIVTGGGTIHESRVLSGFLQTWDVETGREHFKFDQPMPAWGAAFSGDSSQIVSVSEDSTVRVFNAYDGKCSQVFTQLGNPGKVVIGRDGRSVLTADLGSCASPLLADLGLNSHPLPTLRPNADKIVGLRFTTDGLLRFFGEDRRVRTFDPATGKQLQTLIEFPAEWESVVFSDDGRWAIAYDHVPDEDVDIVHEAFDVGTGQRMWRRKLPSPSTLTLLKDGGFLRFPARTRSVARLDSKGNTLWEFEMAERKPSEDLVFGLATSDPKLLVAFESNRQHAMILDAETGKPVGPRWDLPGQVRSASLFPNGREIIVAFNEGFIQSFDLTTRKPTGAAIPWRGEGTGIHLSPDGRALAVLTGRLGTQSLSVFDSKTGLILGPTETFDRTNEIRSVAFHPNSRILAAGGIRGEVHFWNIATELKGTAAQIRCWTEMIGRAEWVAEPTETMRNLDDKEVGQRRKRLLEEWGLDSAMRPANR